MKSTTCTKPLQPRSRSAMAHGAQEGHFDVEEQENHRDEIELHRLALARVADRRHAALVGRRLSGVGLRGPRRLESTIEISANPAPSAIMIRMESQPCIGRS